VTRRGFRMRRELMGWALEELASGRYRRSFSLLRAAIAGDLS
jgi:hypothetical protein